MGEMRKKYFPSNELSAWSACRNFFNKNFPSHAKVGIYWPMNYEIDTRPLIKILLEKKFNLCLPTIINNNMSFKSWGKNDDLKLNHFKFYEPHKSALISKPDIIIVPLLAFDDLGYRVGYGKGFYDKYYEKNLGVNYIGYAYSFQRIKNLPVESYDLKLNSVITDTFVKDFN